MEENDDELRQRIVDAHVGLRHDLNNMAYPKMMFTGKFRGDVMDRFGPLLVNEKKERPDAALEAPHEDVVKAAF